MKHTMYLLLVIAMVLVGCTASLTPKTEENSSPALAAFGPEANARRIAAYDGAETDTGMSKLEEAALAEAQKYLSADRVSRSELIGALEQDGFPVDAAEAAVYHCEVDWNGQALVCAEHYLENMAGSERMIRESLEENRFTQAEIAYAMEQLPPANWKRESEEYVEEMLAIGASYDSIIRNMEAAGFDRSQMEQARERLRDVDWNRQALRKGTYYAQLPENYNREELIQLLEREGFTPEQAAYAADQCGY